MFEQNTLEEICESVEERLATELPRIIIALNRAGKLEEWLSMMNMEDIIPQERPKYQSYQTGRIVILGPSSVNESVLIGIAKGLGIDKNRLELYLEYKGTVSYPYSKLQYNPDYSLVLVGPMPHSTIGKGEYSSAIAAMESEEGYPPVIRLGQNQLKISKSNVKAALQEAIEKGYIVA